MPDLERVPASPATPPLAALRLASPAGSPPPALQVPGEQKQGAGLRPLALPVREKERKSLDREGTPVAAKMRQKSEEREVTSEAWDCDGEEARGFGGKGQVSGMGRDVGAEEETLMGGDQHPNEGRVGVFANDAALPAGRWSWTRKRDRKVLKALREAEAIASTKRLGKGEVKTGTATPVDVAQVTSDARPSAPIPEGAEGGDDRELLQPMDRQWTALSVQAQPDRASLSISVSPQVCTISADCTSWHASWLASLFGHHRH